MTWYLSCIRIPTKQRGARAQTPHLLVIPVCKIDQATSRPELRVPGVEVGVKTQFDGFYLSLLRWEFQIPERLNCFQVDRIMLHLNDGTNTNIWKWKSLMLESCIHNVLFPQVHLRTAVWSSYLMNCPWDTHPDIPNLSLSKVTQLCPALKM